MAPRNAPGRRIAPSLVWLYEYQSDYAHTFWFAEPLALPAGTTISGVPDDARVLLIPASGR